MNEDFSTRYKKLKTKQQYINFYKIEKVVAQYAKSDFAGLSPLITKAETGAVLSLCKSNKVSMNSLLDLATGSARILTVLEKHFKNSVGIDSSPLMLKVANARVKMAKLIIADIEKLPFKNNAFDVITGFRFIINVPKSSRHKMLLEIKRVLKSEGLIIINIHHNKISPRGIKDIISKNRPLSKTISFFGLKKEFQSAGLKIVAKKGINIALLTLLLPFIDRNFLLKIDSLTSSLPLINILSDTLIISAKKN